MSAVAVIGGGIAGLTAAYHLSAEHDVVVFEHEAIAGGKIRSRWRDGFLFESGPSGFLSSAGGLRELVGELDLDAELIEADPAAKNRFIYWDGTLHKLPSKPPEVLRMSLLSLRGKLRALGELVVPVRSAEEQGEDESVAAFIARRFGREVAERIAAPALLGISGGDAATTSLGAVFPRLPELERRAGSVIRGMARGNRRPARMCSFADGMQRLTDRLAERLGNRLFLGTSVVRLEHHRTGWKVTLASGEAKLVRGLIVATPSDITAGLVAPFDGELAAQLQRIPYAPMRVLALAFAAADVPVTLDGFGFLSARRCGVRILGAVYTSTLMPQHARPGMVYLRVFMGGATDTAVASLHAEEARALALADLRTVLGITAEPIVAHEALWTKAIPQYTLAHRTHVRAIEARAAAHACFGLTGNAYRGLGVGDAVTDARDIAARVGAACKQVD